MRPWYSSRAEKALPTVPGIPAHLHADVFQEYRQLVGKLWGDEAGHRLLSQVPEHGARLRTLMADAEPA